MKDARMKGERKAEAEAQSQAFARHPPCERDRSIRSAMFKQHGGSLFSYSLAALPHVLDVALDELAKAVRDKSVIAPADNHDAPVVIFGAGDCPRPTPNAIVGKTKYLRGFVRTAGFLIGCGYSSATDLIRVKGHQSVTFSSDEMPSTWHDRSKYWRKSWGTWTPHSSSRLVTSRSE